MSEVYIISLARLTQTARKYCVELAWKGLSDKIAAHSGDTAMEVQLVTARSKALAELSSC